jgi:hypothetical protein
MSEPVLILNEARIIHKQVQVVFGAETTEALILTVI